MSVQGSYLIEMAKDYFGLEDGEKVYIDERCEHEVDPKEFYPANCMVYVK